MVFAPGLSKGGKEVGAGLKPAPISSEQVLSPIRETEAPATTPVSPPLALRQEIRREAEPPVNRAAAKEKNKKRGNARTRSLESIEGRSMAKPTGV